MGPCTFHRLEARSPIRTAQPAISESHFCSPTKERDFPRAPKRRPSRQYTPIRPELYTTRRVRNEERERPAVGSAQINGPHMIPQCKLPTRPRTKAVQSWMVILSTNAQLMVFQSFHNHGLFVVVILAIRGPIQADFPKAGPELAGLQVLHSFGADGKRQILIERGV